MKMTYENDFYGWTLETATLLKQKKFHEADIDNIIEEIESMGRSEKNQLINRLAVLMAHLLKWQHQPDFRGRSWQGTIKEQRKRIQLLLKDNPSLKSKRDEIFADSYEIALDLIEKETPIDLKLLPTLCPYTFDQCVEKDFYPA